MFFISLKFYLSEKARKTESQNMISQSGIETFSPRRETSKTNKRNPLVNLLPFPNVYSNFFVNDVFQAIFYYKHPLFHKNDSQVLKFFISWNLASRGISWYNDFC